MSARARTALVAAAMIAASAAFGCSTSHPAAPSTSTGVQTGSDSCPAGPALAVATGRANSPQAELTGAVTNLVAHGFDTNAPFAVLDTGARPHLTTAQLGSDAANSAARSADKQDQLDAVASALDHVVADTPQADPWTSVGLAVAWLRAQGGGTLVVEDSGLGTVGWLNYTSPGLLGADPGQLVAYARQSHELPDATGISVLLVGLGYTAPPQQPLDQATRSTVVAQYAALLAAAGACVATDPSPLTGPGPAKAPPVDPVAAPSVAAPTGSCGQTLGSDQVRFIVGTANLADPTAATAAVQSVVNQLLASHAVATITGTTSSEGSQQTNDTLALARADKVQQIVLSLGLPAAQIAGVLGLGSHFPGFVPDINPAGQLLPGPAAANRKVIITWRCPTG